ncbi:adenylyltransferase/cytidyltransferase family protein [Candidatus Poribacteria bacterium]|nr:adenylyltransferase/cytidyltransferase family protein [Candidatus Poribacteria bacterium]
MGRTVFVSGCYDTIHGGHIEFFRAARALGDRLVVSVASDRVLMRHKYRLPAMPEQHRLEVVRAIQYVDEAYLSSGDRVGLDFQEVFERINPSILAVTQDDRFESMKRELCAKVGCEYVVLPKTLTYEQISSTEMRARAAAPWMVPLRVDIAGGWLDYVKASGGIEGYVVNCSVSPLVGIGEWSYEKGAGLGGSAAWSALHGNNSFLSEWAGGRGWQDPAVVLETGLCVWRAGDAAGLVMKRNPAFLKGHMVAVWTYARDESFDPALIHRDYDAIVEAGETAMRGALNSDIDLLREAIDRSYEVQLDERMPPLPEAGGASRKYCGAGWGGYALYLFDDPDRRESFVSSTPGSIPVEPHMRYMEFAAELDDRVNPHQG